MSISASTVIHTSQDNIWKIVTDIENAEKNISAISKINILEKPESGLVGLKWEETRIMFGKEATETMWITEAKDNEWYETMAHNCGCIYKSRVQLESLSEGVKLTMTFQSTPQTFMAKLMSPLGILFSGMIRKAFEQDLRELKEKLEKMDGYKGSV